MSQIQHNDGRASSAVESTSLHCGDFRNLNFREELRLRHEQCTQVSKNQDRGGETRRGNMMPGSYTNKSTCPYLDTNLSTLASSSRSLSRFTNLYILQQTCCIPDCVPILPASEGNMPAYVFILIWSACVSVDRAPLAAVNASFNRAAVAVT